MSIRLVIEISKLKDELDYDKLDYDEIYGEERLYQMRNSSMQWIAVIFAALLASFTTFMVSVRPIKVELVQVKDEVRVLQQTPRLPENLQSTPSTDSANADDTQIYLDELNVQFSSSTQNPKCSAYSVTNLRHHNERFFRGIEILSVLPASSNPLSKGNTIETETLTFNLSNYDCKYLDGSLFVYSTRDDFMGPTIVSIYLDDNEQPIYQSPGLVSSSPTIFIENLDISGSYKLIITASTPIFDIYYDETRKIQLADAVLHN